MHCSLPNPLARILFLLHTCLSSNSQNYFLDLVLNNGKMESEIVTYLCKKYLYIFCTFRKIFSNIFKASSALRARVDDFILFDWKRFERDHESHVVKELAVANSCKDRDVLIIASELHIQFIAIILQSTTYFCLVIPAKMASQMDLRFLIQTPFNLATRMKRHRDAINVVSNSRIYMLYCIDQAKVDDNMYCCEYTNN